MSHCVILRLIYNHYLHTHAHTHVRMHAHLSYFLLYLVLRFIMNVGNYSLMFRVSITCLTFINNKLIYYKPIYIMHEKYDLGNRSSA